jgi:hypothetical protein
MFSLKSEAQAPVWTRILHMVLLRVVTSLMEARLKPAARTTSILFLGWRMFRRTSSNKLWKISLSDSTLCQLKDSASPCALWETRCNLTTTRCGYRALRTSCMPTLMMAEAGSKRTTPAEHISHSWTKTSALVLSKLSPYATPHSLVPSSTSPLSCLTLSFRPLAIHNQPYTMSKVQGCPEKD